MKDAATRLSAAMENTVVAYAWGFRAQGVCFVALLIALSVPAWARSDGEGPDLDVSTNETDAQLWLQYEFRTNVKERFRLSWNLAYREMLSGGEDLLGGWTRVHATGDVVYSYTDRVRFQGGSGAYYSFVRDDLYTDRSEFRLWQGALFRWPETTYKRREWALHHRLRLEERFVRNMGSGRTEFALRGRYRISTFILLNPRHRNDVGAYYLRPMAEYFFDIGSDVSELFAARVRLTTAVGGVVSKNWTLEFRYTIQSSRDTAADLFDTTDHIFDFRVRTSLRIRELRTAVTGW